MCWWRNICDHTPLHRQAGIYAREGVQLDRATLADWVGKAVFLLAPLAEMIGRHVRAGARAACRRQCAAEAHRREGLHDLTFCVCKLR